MHFFPTPRGYGVESTEVVDPENVEVLWPTVDAELMLVTCCPFNYFEAAPNASLFMHANGIDRIQNPVELPTSMEKGIL
jgi:LPXTG-site transpeptidase (sortase) family protein